MISGVFTNIFGSKKSKTLGGIHETRQKKIKLPGHPAGPSGLRSDPRAQPGQQVVSIYFYFALHETTLVSRFLAKNTRETTKKVKKNSWNQITRKKKTRFVFKTLETRETGLLANFMPKRHKKKCPVSVKLGQFFETMDSFSETGLKLSVVSAETRKIIR